MGYQVLEAEPADPALAILGSRQHIDLLFTDVVLPGKSGKALADEAMKFPSRAEDPSPRATPATPSCITAEWIRASSSYRSPSPSSSRPCGTCSTSLESGCSGSSKLPPSRKAAATGVPRRSCQDRRVSSGSGLLAPSTIEVCDSFARYNPKFTDRLASSPECIEQPFGHEFADRVIASVQEFSACFVKHCLEVPFVPITQVVDHRCKLLFDSSHRSDLH